ncbi:MAG TPA: ribonuclease Y [Candidatus Bathyarchaeia archaeon]|nr:ribonuclease Y [Candidatus Bathyarchaeia archaeon]
MASIFARLKQVLTGEFSSKEPVKEEPIPEPVKAKLRKVKVTVPKVQIEELIDQAKKEAARIKSEAETSAAKMGQEAEELRKQVILQEAEMGRKRGILEERERIIEERRKEVERRLEEIEKLKREQVARFEKIAGLTREEAKKIIVDKTEKKLAEEISVRVQEAEEEIKARSEEKAKEVLVEAMQRGATDWVVEYTVSTLRLADEEIKGRIIGREGRNIRAFEQATGVEIELDETSDVYISSFNPIRREIARRALEILVKDRRIRPSRIEEVVTRTKGEVEHLLIEQGKELCRRAGVYRLHPDLMKLLGRYKFRFSFGQNLLVHTLEVTKIGVALANELKANVNVIRLACLLHDIGKVVTEEEGTHVNLGVDLAKRYHLPPEVISCIEEHHEDKPFSSAESRIVWVADAVSGARPGARYEPHEEYLKRMTEIEETASNIEGVEAAYAYQAGREVRVLVKPEAVSDKELPLLAHRISQELEKKVAYVGQIKVTCIRESRTTETTKAK